MTDNVKRGAFYWDRGLWVDPYKLIWRPLMFRFDAERAHHLSLFMIGVVPVWLILALCEERKLFP